PAAAAGKDGTGWLAYNQVPHYKEHHPPRGPPEQGPSDFLGFKKPTRGDQNFLRQNLNGALGGGVAGTQARRAPFQAAEVGGGGGWERAALGVLVSECEGQFRRLGEGSGERQTGLGGADLKRAGLRRGCGGHDRFEGARLGGVARVAERKGCHLFGDTGR